MTPWDKHHIRGLMISGVSVILRLLDAESELLL
jgi:hypothetical protein